ALALNFGDSKPDFEQRFHRYVSGDPSVDPAGTPFPEPAPKRAGPTLALKMILDAAASATPWSAPIDRDRIAVRLAYEQGWTDPALLAAALGISARTVRRHASELDDGDSLARAALCLGDARLRNHCPRIWPKSGQKGGQ